MTNEQFDFLVRRLERDARENPSGYHFRVFLLALLGYAYIFLALALVGGIVYGAIWLFTHGARPSVGLLKIALPVLTSLGLFALIVLRALWVPLNEPEGMELKRTEAVPLFQAVDRLRTQLKVPRFHRVILTHDFNAGVVQTPRLGVFGWQKNFLLLGLPLLLTLSPDEFRAVLAHELGHVSQAHGRFGGWIYRVNKTWFQLLETFAHEGHNGAVVFAPFFAWYAPFFAAYTFALRRAAEYEADRHAAELVGPRLIADTLIRSELVFRQAAERARPPLPSEQVWRWLNDAMAEKTGTEDTHPALADRLRALKQEPRLPEPSKETAADRFLGHKLVSVAGALGYTS